MPDNEIPFQNEAKKNPLERPELLAHGIREVDNITFTFVNIKYGENDIRTAHEVIFTEGDREFHIMPLLDNRGNLSTALQIVTEKNRSGGDIEARIVFYMLTNKQLTKVMDGKYKGPVTEFSSFRETLQFVLEGKHQNTPITKVEE